MLRLEKVTMVSVHAMSALDLTYPFMDAYKVLRYAPTVLRN